MFFLCRHMRSIALKCFKKLQGSSSRGTYVTYVCLKLSWASRHCVIRTKSL